MEEHAGTAASHSDKPFAEKNEIIPDRARERLNGTLTSLPKRISQAENLPIVFNLCTGDTFSSMTMRADTGSSPSTRSGSSASVQGTPRTESPPARRASTDPPYEPDSGDEEEVSFSRFLDAEDSSRASSTVSEAVEDIPLGDLVDLTDPSKSCLVRMHKRVGNRQIPCICGNHPSACTLRNHEVKRASGNPTLLGMPGFYVEYVSPDGTRTGAGRTDMRFYQASEIAFARDRLASERAAVVHELDVDTDEESHRPTPSSAAADPVLTRPGTRSTLVGFAEPLEEPTVVDLRSAPTPQVRNSASGHKDVVIEGPPAAPLGTPPLWNCLVSPDGRRVATNSIEKVLDFQTKRYELRKAVATYSEAKLWCHEPPTATTSKPPLLPSGTASSGRAVPPATASVGTRSSSATSPQTSLLARISQMSVGRDPSEATQLIHGISPSDEANMDDFLLPPGLTDPDAKADFYDLAMDVTSLPGGYRLNDDDDLTNNEALLAAIGKGRNTHFRSWRRNSHNQLAKIASKEELLRFVSDVEKTVTRTRTAQNQRMRKYLYACSHDSTFVELYVTSGPLPRLIEDTYRSFLALLEALRSAMFEFPEDAWKGSYIHRMLQHHSKELGHIRATSSDYRMHLLETYVYLRNSHKEKFQDPSFVRSLLYNLGKEHTGEPARELAGDSPNRCSHCRRSGTHKGTTKESCPLRLLSRTKAASAVEGLNKAEVKKVMKLITSAMSGNSDANVDEVISSARAEAQS